MTERGRTRRLLEFARTFVASPLGLFSITLGVIGLSMFVLSRIRVESRFSGELLVSELQLEFDKASDLLPVTRVRWFEVDDVGMIEIPWGSLPGGGEQDRSDLLGDVRVESADSDFSLEGFPIRGGTRILVGADPSLGAIQLGFRGLAESALDSTSELRVTIRGKAMIRASQDYPRVMNFSKGRTLVAELPKTDWELGMALVDPEDPLFFPALDVSSLSLQVTQDFLASRVQGRAEQSAILEGKIVVHGIGGDPTLLFSGGFLDLSGAESLRIDEVRLTRTGLRVRFHGRAESLTMTRLGEPDELLPSQFEVLYRTELGQALLAVGLAFVIALLEFLLEALGRPGTTA